MRPFKFTGAVQRRTVNLAAGAVFVCLTASAAAATNNAPLAPSPTAPPLPDVGESFLRVVGALMFVLALFLGGVWLYRHLQGLSLAGGRAQKLKILEARSLGGRQAIYVVGYGDKRLLIGSSATGIQHLRDLPDETEPDPAPDPGKNFGSTLTNQLQGQ